jgi:ribosomal-protein-alanine N-acetyltransferase
VIDVAVASGITTRPTPSSVSSHNWKTALPVLRGHGLTLRDLRLSDAPSLLECLNTEEVSRFISPPPTTVAGFERFIAWAHFERTAGRYVCFAVVPDGCEDAVGIMQVRQLNGSFEVAEWGFAIASRFWGTGVFIEAAQQVLAFAFDSLGTARLEARASTRNGRGNGALQKLGATREGLLRKSFLRDGVYHDQVLWSLIAAEWREGMAIPGPTRH